MSEEKNENNEEIKNENVENNSAEIDETKAC